MTKTKLVVNMTRGRVVCVGEVADRPLPRMRGLIGRRGLPAGEGLLLKPAPAIHTAFMRFAIDAMFLDRDLQVLEIVERLEPWRIAFKRRAHAVLELCAGESARRGVAVGDRLELRDRVAVGAGGPRAAGAKGKEPDNAPAPHEESGELVALAPTRVLVVSHDRHFRTATSLLLAGRCSVTTTSNSGRVRELAAREGTDVVVIDVDQELAALRTAATLEEFSPGIGVVLITEEEPRSGQRGPSRLTKWAPFGDLLAAIERAARQRATRKETGVRH